MWRSRARGALQSRGGCNGLRATYPHASYPLSVGTANAAAAAAAAATAVGDEAFASPEIGETLLPPQRPEPLAGASCNGDTAAADAKVQRMIAVIDRREKHREAETYECGQRSQGNIYINAVGDRKGYVFETMSHFMLAIFMPSVFRSGVLFVGADLCCITLIFLAMAAKAKASASTLNAWVKPGATELSNKDTSQNE